VQEAGGRCRQYMGDSFLRAAVLDASPSRDALVSSGCVRESTSTGFGSVNTESSDRMATITRRGDLVLRALRTYILPRRLPAPGRELAPGSRSETDARVILEQAPEFSSRLRLVILRARKSPGHRLQLDAPKARGVGERDPSGAFALEEARPDSTTKFHVWPVSPSDAESLSNGPAELRIACNPQDGGTRWVTIEGPLDVLYWLAEDAEAVWG
jgi:hypothetical protein